MTYRKKILIFITSLTAVLIVAWLTGCFTPFNYFTAKWDLWHGNVRLVEYGLPPQRVAGEDSIRHKYGFYEMSGAGCIVDYDEANGMDIYNSVVRVYLEKRNGKGWSDRCNRELDSLRSTIVVLSPK
jgi:hypothetical protein